ncbi:MAG: nucleoside deaminase, partial [Alphaproteobacteria bacterium]|nr:nucleoside deaminase [Alphaproteobacteria bacterium]
NGFRNLDLKIRTERPECTETYMRTRGSEIFEDQSLKDEGYSNDQIVSATHNLVKHRNDPTAHAEILAIQRATKILNTPYLENCDIYVTLEPCPMCASAIAWSRLRRLYFGAYDPKGGGVIHGPRVLEYTFQKPEIIGGILEKECGLLLSDFFKNRRS